MSKNNCPHDFTTTDITGRYSEACGKFWPWPRETEVAA
jgi:hypothetical protein